MELKPNDRSLREILSSYYFFIPRYQRPYSWGTEQVDDLWEDAIQDSVGDYFIGSMVVHAVKGDTLAVIDGQQRLTTLVILLCVLRDAAEAHELTRLANGTHNFIERPDENDVSRFVLHTETSYPFLHDEVLTRGEPELEATVGSEEQKIKAARDRLKKYVDDLVTAITIDPLISKEKKHERIADALQRVRDRILALRLIFIEVGNQDDATTIFVTLNSRGQDLEPSDLIKAHLLQLLPKTSGLDRPFEKWQSIVDAFDASEARINMTNFLLAVWRSRYEVRVTATTIHKKVKKRIKKQHAKTFLDALVTDAELYRQVNEPTYRKWRKDELAAREHLEFFRDFGISQPMPLLLSLMRVFDMKLISFRQLRRSLKAIEDYHFTWNTIANKSSSGGMSNLFARKAIDLLLATSPSERGLQVDSLVDDLKNRRPTNAEFDDGFTSLWFTDDHTSQKRVVQYVLRRFYQHHNSGGVVDFDKMTIEHLAPQSSKAGEVGRVGNLILLSRDANNALESKGFPAKIATLQKFPTEWLPEDVAQAESWDSAAIIRRTQTMAEFGRTAIWRG